MIITTHVPGKGTDVQRYTRGFLTLMAHIWADHIGRPWVDGNGVTHPPLPPLYETEVRYQPEPNSGTGFEQFDSPWQVYQRGHGDCDDLVGWRLAELLARGVRRAKIDIVRGTGDKSNAMHARITLPNGATDDPSIKMIRRESVRKYGRPDVPRRKV